LAVLSPSCYFCLYHGIGLGTCGLIDIRVLYSIGCVRTVLSHLQILTYLYILIGVKTPMSTTLL